VGDLNIANKNCCIGRGVAALNSRLECNSFLYYLMNEVKNQFTISNDEGTIFGSITKEGLHAIEIINPWENVGKECEKIANGIDKQIELSCTELERLKYVNTLLLSKMATVGSEEEIINIK